MVLKILKKTKVPDELPELVSDKIEKEELNKNSKKTEEKIIEEKETKEEKPIEKVNEDTQNKKEIPKIEEKEKPKIVEEKQNEEKTIVKETKIEPKSLDIENLKNLKNNSGFFNELEKYLTKEIVNLDELENWYNNKFLPRDIVSDMRNYWEKQKNNSIINLLGKNFQEKITQKTIELQNLEREWQGIYFKLIEKEEEIRESEKELKKMLSDFVEICKKGNINNLASNKNQDKIINLTENSKDKIISLI